MAEASISSALCWNSKAHSAELSRPDHTSSFYRDKLVANKTSSTLRKASLFYLVFVMFSYTTDGPFGLEDMVTTSGPSMTLIYLLVLPFFWCIPVSLAKLRLTHGWVLVSFSVLVRFLLSIHDHSMKKDDVPVGQIII